MYCLLVLLVTCTTATVMSGIHKVILDTNSWSPWSPWTPCSRSCGSEGIQTRRRVCLSSQGCDGVANAWRVCALSECPEPSRSLRDEQCARYNNVPYQGMDDYFFSLSHVAFATILLQIINFTTSNIILKLL